MGDGPIGVLLAFLVLILLLTALAIVRVFPRLSPTSALENYGDIRKMSGRQRRVSSIVAIGVITVGVIAILTRARYLGNWWWGVVGVWCILAGGVVLWNVLGRGSGRRVNARRSGRA